MQHLRALAVLVTLLSLSLLFSTFTASYYTGRPATDGDGQLLDPHQHTVEPGGGGGKSIIVAGKVSRRCFSLLRNCRFASLLLCDGLAFRSFYFFHFSLADRRDRRSDG